MRVIYERDKNRLIVGEVVFTVTNNVRNEIDPRNVRRLHDPKEVRRVIRLDRSVGSPYMPRKFPKGTWAITAVEWFKDGAWDRKDYGLVRIRTNAHQSVAAWSLDDNGGYDKPSGKMEEDYGYLFHASDSRTTLGCGKFETQEQALKCAQLIADALANGIVVLEVV